MDSFRKLPIGDFAEELKISRNTAKRLFDQGVFPDEWIVRSQGGKWFVLIDDERLPQARHSLRRWSIIRRRPEASRAFPDPLSIEGLALELFCIRLFHEGLSDKNHREFTRRFFTERGQRIYTNELERLKEVSRDPQHQAIFLVAAKLIGFQNRYAYDRKPDSMELAELLLCSVASLYRPPFGKTVLSAARDLIKLALHPCSISDLDALDDKYGPRLTARRIRGHLLISLRRAEDLLEEWRLNEDYPAESFPFGFTRESTADAQESGYSVRQTKKPRNLSTGECERKRLKDRTRRNAETMYHLAWELDDVAGGTLYLSALPSRAITTVARYKNMRDRKTPQKNSYERARAKIDEKRERLGCVFPLEGGFRRHAFYDDGFTADLSFPTLVDAVADLHRRLRARPTPEKLQPPDWEALEAKAVELWSDYTQHRDPSVANKTEVDT